MAAAAQAMGRRGGRGSSHRTLPVPPRCVLVLSSETGVHCLLLSMLLNLTATSPVCKWTPSLADGDNPIYSSYSSPLVVYV